MLHENLKYFQKRLVERSGRLWASFRSEGFAGLGRRVAHHIDWLRSYRRRDAIFDRQFGVDTAGPVELWRFHIASRNARFGNRYEAVDPDVLQEALAAVGEDFRSFTFVDLGCGKGRALLLAQRWGFAKIVGVEFAAQLAEIARRNCARLGVSAAINQEDAAAFSFPDGNLVVHLFNPFGPEVFDRVIDNLLTSQSGARYLLYLNPKHAECLECRPLMRRLIQQKTYEVWKVINPTPVASPSFSDSPSAPFPSPVG